MIKSKISNRSELVRSQLPLLVTTILAAGFAVFEAVTRIKISEIWVLELNGLNAAAL